MRPYLLPVTGPALDRQFVAEETAKQRHYVLANTRARWGFVGFAIALLATVSLFKIVPLSLVFVAAFAAVFGALLLVFDVLTGRSRT